jgi:hypothetical protein
MELSNQPTLTPATNSVPNQVLPIDSVKPKSSSSFTVLNLILIILVGAIIFLIVQNRQLKQQTQVKSYEECVAAVGSLLQTSYPATCVTKSGQQFIQPINPEESQGLPTEPGLEPETLPEQSESIRTTNGSEINATNKSIVYTSSRVNSFHSPFVLTYPSGWQIKVESNTATDDSGNLTVNLTRTGAKIMIQQAAMDGAGCYYPDETFEEGMSKHYGQYTEIQQGNLRWRVAQDLNATTPTYRVCEYKPETKHFAELTQVGIAFLELTKDNAATVEEFTQMIKSLKILP